MGVFATSSASFIHFTRKTHQTLIVDIYLKRIDPSDEHINSQVKLIATNEQRIWNVFAYHVRFLRWKLTQILQKENTSSSRRLGRFHDPNIICVVSKVAIIVISGSQGTSAQTSLQWVINLCVSFPKRSHFVWQNVTFRQIVELLRPKLLPHLHKVDVDAIFPSQLGRVEEVIHSLKLGQLVIYLRLVIQTVAGPEQGPLVGVVGAAQHRILLQNLPDQPRFSHSFEGGIFGVLIARLARCRGYRGEKRSHILSQQGQLTLKIVNFSINLHCVNAASPLVSNFSRRKVLELGPNLVTNVRATTEHFLVFPAPMRLQNLKFLVKLFELSYELGWDHLLGVKGFWGGPEGGHATHARFFHLLLQTANTLPQAPHTFLDHLHLKNTGQGCRIK